MRSKQWKKCSAKWAVCNNRNPGEQCGCLRDFCLCIRLNLYRVESAPDNLAGIGDQDKCARLGFLDEVTEPYCLRTVQCCQNNVFLLPGEDTLGGINGCSTVQVPDDEVTDRLRTVADNIETLGKVEAFDEVVCDEGAKDKSQDGEETCLHTKYEYTCHSNSNVGNHQDTPDVVTGIFFQYHRYNIGSPAGCTHIKQDCGAESRNSDRKDQFQYRLIGQRAVHRVNTFQDGQEKRKEHTAVKCFCSKALSHNQESQNKKNDVTDKVEITAADGSGLCDKNGKTGNAAECKVICKFEKVNTACHDGGRNRHDYKIPDFGFWFNVG